MPMETRSSSALFKRAEQLKRWTESDTNRESDQVPSSKRRKIKFTSETIFLAACASGEKTEVERLLQMGADINTANVDGLTALHQACIDDNLDMVEFLVEHGCDVNRGDNEGWTPLHATASCGFLSIARCLLENGANVAAVNNDGELPIDIADLRPMEELLQGEISKLGVDCDAVRTEEERMMMEDAKQWILSKKVQDKVHPKTGATALHVASAKGYIKVMSLLIQAGVDLNVQDNDGWTALHAAAHWGQREACEILADSLANMDIQNFAGQTCFDIADADLLKVLEELKKKQTTLQKEKPEILAILQRRAPPPPLKRRTSVTRMSCADKSSVVMKDTTAERAQIEANLRLDDLLEEDGAAEKKAAPVLPDGLVSAIQEEDLEIARKNELNRVDRIHASPPDPFSNNLGQERDSEQPSVADEESVVVPWRKGARRPGSFSTPPQSPTDNTQFLEANIILRPKQPVATTNESQKEAEDSSQQREESESEASESSPEVQDDQTTQITGQVRRVFLPPARDDESESQRKAHAKRVRETRRSTQGVTLEDLKSAEQQLLRKEQEEDERKEEGRKSNGEDVVATDQGEEGQLPQRRPSWRSSRNGESEQPSVTPSTRQRPVSAPLLPTVESPDGTPSVTLLLRSRLKSEDKSEIDGSEGKTTPGITQAAIQRRRRPKRRSTGVVILDGEVLEENQNNNTNNSVTDESVTDGKLIEETGEKQRNRYGNSSQQQDGSSRLGDRSRTSSLTSSTDSLGEKELRKLYEEVKEENERLKMKLKRTEGELEDTKRQLDRAQNNNMKSSLSDSDKRERRALERKLSEMEEELKSLAKVKSENEKLKAENRALTRVVSNLSK